MPRLMAGARQSWGVLLRWLRAHRPPGPSWRSRSSASG